MNRITKDTVVIHTATGEKFIGTTRLNTDGSHVDLKGARAIIAHTQMVPQRNGMGVQAITLIAGVDNSENPVDLTIDMRGSVLYRPYHNEALKDKLDKLLENAEKQETAQRAQRSGLTLPGAPLTDIGGK